MPLQTTVLGAWPKPDYLQLPDWFTSSVYEELTPCAGGYEPSLYTNFVNKQDVKKLESDIQKAIRDVINQQTDIGIDVITDGEMRRENYVLHFTRQLQGCDFQQLSTLLPRDGAYKTSGPTITGHLQLRGDSPLVREWKESQQVSSKPVKYTLPGPMTIFDTTVNQFYPDKKSCCSELAKCVNQTVLELVAGGCKHIQVDEPVLMRYPQHAQEYGIELLKKCFQGVGAGTCKIVHLCCGYPDRLDFDDYPKADEDNYGVLAEQLDGAGFDAVSIEDAEVRNDLSLLSKFRRSSVILGCVRVARSHVETVEEIRERVEEALRYIPAERLILAPDCGLGFLPLDVLKRKLTNMVAAAREV